MPLFWQNYNKPGPGISKDEPRKKGIARFIELIARDFGNLVKLNLLYQLCILPSQVLLFFAYFFFGSGISIIFWVSALVACIPLGPARTTVFYCVSKMLRDEPGFIGHDFRKVFLSNFRSMVLPGLVYGLAVGMQAFYAISLLSLHENVPFSLLSFAILILVIALIAPYMFLQAGYLDLKVPTMVKNCFFLTFAYFPRSIASAVLSGALMIAQTVINLMLSFVLLPVTLLVGYVFPCLISLMFIWPPVDRTFSIEKTLLEREESAVISDIEQIEQ